MRIRLMAASLMAIMLARAAAAVQAPAPISAAEKAAGWRHLFYGTDLDAWRGYKQDAIPENWTVGLGYVLTTTGEGADLITKDEFGDFELSLDWKASPGGNSGIIYRANEKLDAAWQTGPEYQLLDDAGSKIEATDAHSAGALYDIQGPSADKVLKAAGDWNAEWNHARIRVYHGIVQHWLNGVKVVEYRTDDDAWKQVIAKSKFKEYEGFGMQKRGHIALQSHGNPMWFRNIRVRDLDAPMPGEIKLFDGKTLSGWSFVPTDAPIEMTWSVKDGIIYDTGEPNGYLRTDKEHTNFVLKLEWRFNPVTKQAGNSGVLLRVTGEPKVWPHSIEAQLLSEQAGDFYGIGGFVYTGDPARVDGRHTAHSHMAEHPVGEWNDYEIILDGENLQLFINGEPVNSATGVEVEPGAIALQAESAEIHFRNVRLAPIAP